jgi:spore photoproduct lyase
MKKKADYGIKFQSLKEMLLYKRLPAQDRRVVESLAFHYRLTFQEFKKLVEAARDLDQWQEQTLIEWWHKQKPENVKTKDQFLNRFHHGQQVLRSMKKKYPKDFIGTTAVPQAKTVKLSISDKVISGLCPVASEKTVCCNLNTIDVVENCPYACSYCTIQTFYNDNYIFDKQLEDKLNSIKLDSKRFYHFGSGQSSDALAWGNKYGILDAQCQFAERNPNILLEFKTKSNAIDYFLNHKLPKNIVISWTLNTQTIIQNEEHQTVSLEERVRAACRVVERGIKVAFHFHPIVYYDGWEKEYMDLVRTVLDRFKPGDILFISFGTVTLIKPVLEKIRLMGLPTKITQMEMVKDPLGKYTYPVELKITMYRHLYALFAPWKDLVFFYLCMETKKIWDDVLGYSYESNEIFEAEYGRKTMMKIFNYR